MSYDVWLTADLGGPSPVTLPLDWNYTTGFQRMWAKAMPETNGLDGMNGITAKQAGESLARGISAMAADPGAYRALYPVNGCWEGFEDQLDALGKVLAACEEAPHAIVRVSR